MTTPDLTLSNLFKLLSFMSPFFIAFFMILLSIINNALGKGVVYLTGLMITTVIIYILKYVLKDKQNEMASPFCNVLPIPFTIKGESGDIIYSSPTLSTAILGYTSGYLIFPMHINNETNPVLLTFLVAMLCINAVTEFLNFCSPLTGIILGAIVGIVFGILYYSALSATGNKEVAYFNSVTSNASKCSKPSKQKFKCVTYVRGEPI